MLDMGHKIPSESVLCRPCGSARQTAVMEGVFDTPNNCEVQPSCATSTTTGKAARPTHQNALSTLGGLNGAASLETYRPIDGQL